MTIKSSIMRKIGIYGYKLKRGSLAASFHPIHASQWSKPGSQVPIIIKQKYNLQNRLPLCSHLRFMYPNNIRLSLHDKNHIFYSFNTYFCQIAKHFVSIADFILFRSAMLSQNIFFDRRLFVCLSCIFAVLRHFLTEQLGATETLSAI